MDEDIDISPELIPRLHRRLNELASSHPHKILSPTIQPRRASVAIIIRVRPSYAIHAQELTRPICTTVDEFFNQRWVQDGIPEILYIRRAHSKSDRWSHHMAFPGGTKEKRDKDDSECAIRETFEEIGYDLSERNEFLPVGELDDREVTSSFGRRLLMVLSAFVYIHLVPPGEYVQGNSPRVFQQPKLQPEEVDSLHWIPLDCLVPCRNGKKPQWSEIKVEVVTRLTKRWILQRILAALLGRMSFHCILLPNNPTIKSSGKTFTQNNDLSSEDADMDASIKNPRKEISLQLWGLTLGMTMDLLAPTFQTNPPRHFLLTQVMNLPLPGKKKASAASPARYGLGGNNMTQNYSPGTYTLFPRFTYLDVDLMVWCFAHRYRRLAHRRMMSTVSSSTPSPSPITSTSPSPLKPPSRRGSPSYSPTNSSAPFMPMRIHHHSLAMTYYYSAVRRGLVAATIVRVLILLALFRLGWVKYLLPLIGKSRKSP